MNPTWIAVGTVALVSGGYVVVRRVPRPRFVCWSLLAASLFALATRDLFRPRERPGGEASGGRGRQARERRAGRARDAANERDRGRPSARPSDRSTGDTPAPLVARLRRRFARWLD